MTDHSNDVTRATARALADARRRAAAPPRPSSEDEVAAEIAGTVEQVVAGLDRKHHLTDRFGLIDSRRLCRLGGELCQNGDLERGSWRSLPDVALISGLQDDAELAWVLPYPNVRLGWATITENLPFVDLHPGADRPAADGRRVGPVPAAGAAGRRRGRILGEVRLSILPTGPAGRSQGTFMTRPWTVVGPSQPARDPGGRPGCEPAAPGMPRDAAYPGLPEKLAEWRDLGFRAEFAPGDYAAALEDFGLGGAGLGCEHWFLPDLDSGEVTRLDVVSPASCRRLMDLKAVPSPLTGAWPDVVGAEPDVDLVGPEAMAAYLRAPAPRTSPPDSPGEHMLAPPGSLANVLERSIFHAAPEWRLDRVLDAACAKHAVEVEGYLTPFEAWRQRVKAELRALWG
jgi:hypothetical protein